MAISIVKDEFRNVSGALIGVVTISTRGEVKSIAVANDDTVWLSEEEQILTANAPRTEEANPLTNGQLKLETAAKAMKNKRKLRPQDEAEKQRVEEELATPMALAGATQTTGSSAGGEESATPEAKPKRRAS
jgi:hypothetical protein